jgi:hypothetical protein
MYLVLFYIQITKLINTYRIRLVISLAGLLSGSILEVSYQAGCLVIISIVFGVFRIFPTLVRRIQTKQVFRR